MVTTVTSPCLAIDASVFHVNGRDFRPTETKLTQAKTKTLGYLFPISFKAIVAWTIHHLLLDMNCVA